MGNSKLVTKILMELTSVHLKLDEHLAEGVGVKRDIQWLKWLIGIIFVGILSLWLKR